MDPIQQVPSSAPVEQPIITPEATPQYKYAGFWVRFVAYCIDSFIVTVGLVLLAIPFVLVFSIGSEDESMGAIVGLVAWVVMVGGYYLYFILFTHHKQATPGKMVLGLVVIKEDGERLSLGSIVLREVVGKVISYIIFYIGYIIAAFTQKKQALHDFMAHSVVVYKDPNKPSNTAVIVTVVVVGAFLMIVIMGILSSVVLASLSSAREKAKNAAIEAQMMASSTEQEVQDSL